MSDFFCVFSVNLIYYTFIFWGVQPIKRKKTGGKAGSKQKRKKCRKKGLQFFEKRCKLIMHSERDGRDVYNKRTGAFWPEWKIWKNQIFYVGIRITAITGGDTHVTVQELSDGEMIDATGKYIIPGLVDIHTHGAVNARCQ